MDIYVCEDPATSIFRTKELDVPPKSWYLFTKVHGVVTHTTVIFIKENV
jgi:hypothetical protein